MDAITDVPAPRNEPVLSYAAGSAERAAIEAKLKELSGADPVELTATIGCTRRMPGGEPFTVTMPSDHGHVLGHSAHATEADAADAIDAAAQAAPEWAALSFDDRAAIFLRAARPCSDRARPSNRPRSTPRAS